MSTVISSRVKIVLLGTIAAVGYGVVHDQVTVRVCHEYFTVGHPPLIKTESLSLLAVFWGIVSTGWLGAAFGFVLSAIATSAGRPALQISSLSRQAAALLVVMAASAMLAGSLGFELSRRGFIAIPTPSREMIALERHDRFMAVWFAHLTSYLVALAGGGMLLHTVWVERGRPRVLPLFPATRQGILRSAVLFLVLAAVAYFRLRGT